MFFVLVLPIRLLAFPLLVIGFQIFELSRVSIPVQAEFSFGFFSAILTSPYAEEKCLSQLQPKERANYIQ